MRDVESLRDHYVLTLHRWLAAFSERRPEAVRVASEERARPWYLYLTATRGIRAPG